MEKFHDYTVVRAVWGSEPAFHVLRVNNVTSEVSVVSTCDNRGDANKICEHLKSKEEVKR